MRLLRSLHLDGSSPRPGEPFSSIGNAAVKSTPQPKPRREQPPAPSPCQGAAAQPQGQRQPGAALQFSQGHSAVRRENWLSARGFKRAAGGFRKKSKTASPALRPQPAQTRREPPLAARLSRCLQQKQCPHPAGQGRFLRIAPGGAPLTESTQNSLTPRGGGAFLRPAPAPVCDLHNSFNETL